MVSWYDDRAKGFTSQFALCHKPTNYFYAVYFKQKLKYVLVDLLQCVIKLRLWLWILLLCRCEGVHREEGSAHPFGNWDGLCGVKAVQWICLQQSQHQGHMWLWRKLQHMSIVEPRSPRSHPSPVPSIKTEKTERWRGSRRRENLRDVDMTPLLSALFLQTTCVHTLPSPSMCFHV